MTTYSAQSLYVAIVPGDAPVVYGKASAALRHIAGMIPHDDLHAYARLLRLAQTGEYLSAEQVGGDAHGARVYKVEVCRVPHNVARSYSGWSPLPDSWSPSQTD